jgi:hypothetical protein
MYFLKDDVLILGYRAPLPLPEKKKEKRKTGKCM